MNTFVFFRRVAWCFAALAWVTSLIVMVGMLIAGSQIVIEVVMDWATIVIMATLAAMLMQSIPDAAAIIAATVAAGSDDDSGQVRNIRSRD